MLQQQQRLFIRLLQQQQAGQRLAVSSSSTTTTLLAAAASSLLLNSSTSTSSCAQLWTAASCQQPQLHTNQQQRLLSTSSTAPTALSVTLPQQLPCILRTSKPSKARLGSVNTVKYPYALPDAYSDRPWQLRDINGSPQGAVQLPGDVFNVPVRVDIMHQVVRWQRAKARQGTHKTKDRSEVSGGGRKPWAQKGSGRARQGSIRAPQWRGGGIVHGVVPRSYAFDLPRKVRRLGLKSALSAKANEGRLILVSSLLPHTPKTKVMAGKLQALLDLQAAQQAAVQEAQQQSQQGWADEEGQEHQGLGRALLLPQLEEQRSAELQQELEQLRLQLMRKPKRSGQGGEPKLKRQRLLLQLLGQMPQDGGQFVPPPALTQQLEGSSAGAGAVPRLSALIIDASTDGADGGDLMRRAVRNLPGVEVVPALGANVLSLLRRDYVIMTKPGLDALVERLQRPINRLGAAGLAFRKKLQERRAAAARQRLIERRLAGGGGGEEGAAAE